MVVPGPRRWVVVLLVALVLSSTAAGFAGSSVTSPRAAPGSAAVSTRGGGPTTGGSPGLHPAAQAAVASPGIANPATAAARAALSAARAAGVPARDIFVPRPSASPQQIDSSRATGTVRPLYTGSPAPMGLAYYGLSAGPGGTVVASVLNTTRLEASVVANSTGIQPLDLVQSSPDAYGIQLNAVVTGVTLFGTGGYSFWTQNVVEYLPATHLLILVTNVWNFSSAAVNLSSNAFYAHGPKGQQVGNTLYFAEDVLAGPIVYPFDLTLTLTSSITAGRNNVSFSVALTSPTVPAEDFSMPAWDYVVFNSLRAGGTPLATPAPYTADGRQYNAVGLTNDFELIFGGPGGGSQATLFGADATLGLAYWDGTGFVAVPSAFSYGGETGETATGANVAWSNAPAGRPAPGVATYGTMTTGPSFLTGLWNATGPSGSYPVTLSVQPSNAFNVLTPVGTSVNFSVTEPAVVPGALTDVAFLVPGNYSLLTELSDYAPVTTAFQVSGPLTITVNLVPDAALGVYTPLWAFSNAEVAALATSGNGTAGNPYLMTNQQPHPIASTFGLYNDFAFPVYPAVFLRGTTVPTEFYQPPSFSTATNTFTSSPGTHLPSFNDLQYWFWNVSSVAIVGAANISGWFAADTWYPTAFNTFSVVFYEGGHNLVAANTFESEGQGLLLYSGGTFFGPANTGGGNNTVWGNRFLQVPSPSLPSLLNPIPLLPFGLGLALELAESNDLVYNNLVNTPTTAWLLPLNLYTGVPEFFSDAFNVSRQSAANVHFASGFPFEPLSGSIVGTRYQGGNAWWDYGRSNPYNGASNPYNLLPYEERAVTLLYQIFGPSVYYATYIYPGGDHVPLVARALYNVTVTPLHLAGSPVWGAVITNASGRVANFTSANATFAVALPNGSYTITGAPPLGYRDARPVTSTFTIAGGPATASVKFHVAKGYHLITFHEHGLPLGTPWTVTLNGSSPAGYPFNATYTGTGRKLGFVAVSGSYTYRVQTIPGYPVNSPSGSVAVASGGVGVRLKFTAYPYVLTFQESGLPAGHAWAVTVGKQTHKSTTSTIAFSLPNGTYAYTVHTVTNYATTYQGNVTINGSAASVSVVWVHTYPPAPAPALVGVAAPVLSDPLRRA